MSLMRFSIKPQSQFNKWSLERSNSCGYIDILYNDSHNFVRPVY